MSSKRRADGGGKEVNKKSREQEGSFIEDRGKEIYRDNTGEGEG